MTLLMFVVRRLAQQLRCAAPTTPHSILGLVQLDRDTVELVKGLFRRAVLKAGLIYIIVPTIRRLK